MNTETEDLQLDNARGVIDVWLGILQSQVRAARESVPADGRHVLELQQQLYEVARESKALRVTDSATVAVATARYSALIDAHRAAVSGAQ